MNQTMKVVAVLAALLPMLCLAEQEGDWSYFVTDDDRAVVTKYEGYSSSVEIPATLGGYPVMASLAAA